MTFFGEGRSLSSPRLGQLRGEMVWAFSKRPFCFAKPQLSRKKALNRKRLVANQSRGEVPCNRTGDVSETFFGKEEQGSGAPGGFLCRRQKKTSEQSGLCSDVCQDVTDDKNSPWCIALYTIYTIIRGFNGTLHAGKIRAYIVLALALNHQALTQKSARYRKVQEENEKFAMRVYLNRIGFIGEEFKSCREHLYKHLSGNAAWRYGSRENVHSHVNRTGNGGNRHEGE